mmetsp:Transcript_24112/g.67564  ORF Transcript_24112/g.67564 Transcript_24112/m.67564 type:complete len:127 (+) Transcript_24112:2-382(+)
MPNGSRKNGATNEEKAQSRAKWRAKIKWPKRQYVDAWKWERTSCNICGRVMGEGQEPGFACDHIDPSTKLASVSNICNSHEPLKVIKDKLDSELAKCRLLCATCNMLRERHSEEELRLPQQRHRVE